jgi:hypothetical protein
MFYCIEKINKYLTFSLKEEGQEGRHSFKASLKQGDKKDIKQQTVKSKR